MNSIVKHRFPAATYFSDMNEKYSVICSESMVHIYTHDYHKDSSIRIRNPHSAVFIDESSLVIKTMHSQYFQYHIAEHRLEEIINFKSRPVCESTYPIRIDQGRKMIDIQYLSPEKQLFVCPLNEGDHALRYLGYDGDGVVTNLLYDEKRDIIAVVETAGRTINIFEYRGATGEFVEKITCQVDKTVLTCFYKESEYLFVSKDLNRNIVLHDKDNVVRAVIRKFKRMDRQQMNADNVHEYVKEVISWVRVSSSGKYCALIYSDRTEIYTLPRAELIGIFNLRYNHFAGFPDDHTVILGSWETGYLIELNPHDRGVTLDLNFKR